MGFPGGGFQNGLRRMCQAPGRGSGCAGLAGTLRPAPGAECERRLRGSPPPEAWDGAAAAPLMLRLCPVISKHSSVPDLEPVWGAWGLGPQPATVRTGVAVASIPRSSIAVRGPAKGRRLPGLRGLLAPWEMRTPDHVHLPDPRLKGQLTKSPPILVEALARPCLVEAKLRARPQGQPRHGCRGLRWSPVRRSRAGGQGAALPRGCADSGGAPPARELLQGPPLTHLLPSRPGPPG